MVWGDHLSGGTIYFVTSPLLGNCLLACVGQLGVQTGLWVSDNNPSYIPTVILPTLIMDDKISSCLVDIKEKYRNVSFYHTNSIHVT